MRLLKSVILSALLAIAPLGAVAHSLSPFKKKVYANKDTYIVKYTLRNTEEQYSTFTFHLKTKDGEEFTKWKPSKKQVGLFPGEIAEIYFKIDSREERKLYVCSSLESIGYDNEKPRFATNHCSRLWIVR